MKNTHMSSMEISQSQRINFVFERSVVEGSQERQGRKHKQKSNKFER